MAKKKKGKSNQDIDKEEINKEAAAKLLLPLRDSPPSEEPTSTFDDDKESKNRANDIIERLKNMNGPDEDDGVIELNEASYNPKNFRTEDRGDSSDFFNEWGLPRSDLEDPDLNNDTASFILHHGELVPFSEEGILQELENLSDEERKKLGLLSKKKGRVPPTYEDIKDQDSSGGVIVGTLSVPLGEESAETPISPPIRNKYSPPIKSKKPLIVEPKHIEVEQEDEYVSESYLMLRTFLPHAAATTAFLAGVGICGSFAGYFYYTQSGNSISPLVVENDENVNFNEVQQDAESYADYTLQQDHEAYEKAIKTEERHRSVWLGRHQKMDEKKDKEKLEKKLAKESEAAKGLEKIVKEPKKIMKRSRKSAYANPSKPIPDVYFEKSEGSEYFNKGVVVDDDPEGLRIFSRYNGTNIELQLEEDNIFLIPKEVIESGVVYFVATDKSGNITPPKKYEE